MGSFSSFPSSKVYKKGYNGRFMDVEGLHFFCSFEEQDDVFFFMVGMILCHLLRFRNV